MSFSKRKAQNLRRKLRKVNLRTNSAPTEAQNQPGNRSGQNKAREFLYPDQNSS